MKKIKIVFAFIILLALMACSKEDSPAGPAPNPDPDLVANRAPGAFDLIEVADSATKVDLLPTFSWNVSTDPDGDPVTYDLLFDTESDPTTVLADNLTTTSFKVTERLHLTTPYSWKVVAKDPKGKTTQSGVNGFTTRTLNFPPTPVTVAAFPDGIKGHASTVFQNKLWVIGGQATNESLNTVWYSEDGSDWTLSVPPLLDKPFSPRWGHTIAVFDNKLWVIGGSVTLGYANDVWSSENGATWTRSTATAVFSPRYLHTTAVFDDKLWVIGGNDGERKNDVWYSSDGATWVRATAAAAFSPREDHTTAVFDNKLWVIGGDTPGGDKVNDVWYSGDGAVWTQATGAAAFSARDRHTTVVFDDKIWIIGGNDGTDNKNDIWYSSDGVTWARATEAAPFSARFSHTTVVFDNKLWVIGGFGEAAEDMNDVWALD